MGYDEGVRDFFVLMLSSMYVWYTGPSADSTFFRLAQHVIILSKKSIPKGPIYAMHMYFLGSMMQYKNPKTFKL